MRFLLCFFLFVSVDLGPAFSQSPAATPSVSPAAVGALVDSVARAYVGPDGIPSAVVSVVQDTSVLLAQGYGWADGEAKHPPDPARTLYRVGSVSKLFAATAAMQAVEAGAVDLQADVNRVLEDVTVPERFGEPITLHHLLTHTPGFEDRFVNVAAPTAGGVAPLGKFLAGDLPTRVRPPGRVVSYSNHGIALAGHVAATSAGLPYATLIRDRILQPLGMRRSAVSLRMLPDSLRGAIATASNRDARTASAQPLSHFQIVPAAGMLLTAADAARFMMAHLNGGRTPEGRILRPETVRQMHRQQFTHHPAVAGWAYGFMEHPHPSPRILLHGGGTAGFTSLLWLVPARGLGVFVSCNMATSALQDALLDAFMDRFLKPNPPSHAADRSEASAANPDAIVGSYRHVRYPHTTVAKVLALTSHVRIAASDSGLVAEGVGDGPVGLRPMGDGRYRRSDGGTVVLDAQPTGETLLYDDAAAAPAYERISTLETPRAVLGILAVAGLVFLGAVGALGVAWWRQWTALRREQWLAAGIGVAYLAFFVGFPLTFLDGRALSVGYGPPWDLVAVLGLPVLASGATLVLAAWMVRAWMQGIGSPRARVGPTVVVLASAGCCLLLHAWNLLGWHF